MDKKIALSNLLQHFWAYLIDGKGKELNTYEYLDKPETLPFINQLFAEPAPLPDNWNEWVEKEALKLWPVRMVLKKTFPPTGTDYNENIREIWKEGATSVLSKLRPELERLKAENETLRKSLIRAIELTDHEADD